MHSLRGEFTDRLRGATADVLLLSGEGASMVSVTGVFFSHRVKAGDSRTWLQSI